MSRAWWQSGVHAGVWIICLASNAAAIVLFWATCTDIAATPMLVDASVVLILIGLHVTYTWLRPDPFIGPVCGGLAAATWAATIAGVSALAALRTHAQLIDSSLARADMALGLDASALVARISVIPSFRLGEQATELGGL